MKQLSFFLLLMCAGAVQSCFWNPQIDFEEPHSPVIISRAELENSVEALSPQAIAKSGKIYIKDNLMFINDVNKGFQVYNYSNPENPVAIGYIKIPGATDLAVRDNTIYINQAVDLVTLTFNPANNTIVVNHQNQNVFPQKRSPLGAAADVSPDEIVIDWIEE